MLQFDIHRLSLLLGNDYNYFVDEISNIGGVISGSSLLFCFDDYVEPDKISDIDIYFNNIESFIKALKLIQQINSDCDVHLCADFFSRDFTRNTDNFKFLPEISTLHISKFGKKPLKLIYLDFDDMGNFLSYTNMDYLQCAWYNGKLYYTELFENSFKSKIVRYYAMNTKLSELIKASEKKYQIKILSNNKDDPKNDRDCVRDQTPFCNLKYKIITHNNNKIILENKTLGEHKKIKLCKMIIEKNNLVNVFDLNLNQIVEKYNNCSYCDIFDVASISCTSYDNQHFINLTVNSNITHKTTNEFFSASENVLLGLNKFLLYRYPKTKNFTMFYMFYTVNEYVLPFTETFQPKEENILHITNSNYELVEDLKSIFLYGPDQQDINNIIQYAENNRLDHLYINLKTLELPVRKINVKKISLLLDLKRDYANFLYSRHLKSVTAEIINKYFTKLQEFFQLNYFEEIVFHCYEFESHCKKLVQECLVTSKFSIPLNSNIYSQEIKDLCVTSHQKK